MKILCFIKHAPDSAARITIAPDGKSVSPDGIDFNPSAFDEYGIENALVLRDAAGAGEVVVVGLGSDAVLNSLRKALAMGADRAIHVKTSDLSDARGLGKALATAVKDEAPDLAFFGYQAIDTNDGQVPAYVCAALDIPLVSMVTELEVTDGKAVAKRQIEGAVEIVGVSLPAAFACTKGPREPRFPSLPGIMKAKKKPVSVVEVSLEPSQGAVLSLALPAGRAGPRFLGEGVGAVEELLKRLQTEAKVL